MAEPGAGDPGGLREASNTTGPGPAPNGPRGPPVDLPPGGGVDMCTPDGPSSTGDGPTYYRGARPGEPSSFAPRPSDFKIDKATGYVKDTHGVSVFDNPESVASRGFVPYEIDMLSVPNGLRIQQRGKDPRHYEITPDTCANLTPEEYANLLGQIHTR